MKRSRLHIMGASGAGTTTLARAVADRLEARETVRQAEGIVDHVAWAEFLEWARGYDDPDFGGRSRAVHEEWLATLACPVLRLDSGASREALRDAVLAWDPSGGQESSTGRISTTG